MHPDMKFICKCVVSSLAIFSLYVAVMILLGSI